MNEVLNFFSKDLQDIIENQIEEKIEEIRIRVEKPVILKFSNMEKILKYIVSQEEILNILQKACENSIYSYQREISEGFITIKGGHRIGIAGSCVIENGKVININYINSLNFRIARQVLGCSKEIISKIINVEKNTVYNTLIASSPGKGKTTILRDIIRQISNGIKQYKFKGMTVSVIDERSEIASLYKGVSQNDLGIKTDIIDSIPKNLGMKMMIRSMSPEVIVADEIGTLEDSKIINYAICSGCKGIFTAHGTSFEDIYLNPILKEIINMHIFEKIIFLDEESKGNIKEIYTLNRKNYEYNKTEYKNEFLQESVFINDSY